MNYEQYEEERYMKDFQKRTYNLYLKSEKWQDIRRLALKHYFNRCCICGATTNLQVHHINYNHIFKETVEDLTVLCSGCHKKNSRTAKRKSSK